MKRQLSKKFLEENPNIKDFRYPEWGANLAMLYREPGDTKQQATGIMLARGIKNGDLILVNNSTYGQILEVVDVVYETNPPDYCKVKFVGYGILEVTDFED